MARKRGVWVVLGEELDFSEMRHKAGAAFLRYGG